MWRKTHYKLSDLSGLQVFVSATTITGNAVCDSTTMTYRLDTQSARGLLGTT